MFLYIFIFCVPNKTEYFIFKKKPETFIYVSWHITKNEMNITLIECNIFKLLIKSWCFFLLSFFGCFVGRSSHTGLSYSNAKFISFLTLNKQIFLKGLVCIILMVFIFQITLFVYMGFCLIKWRLN